MISKKLVLKVLLKQKLLSHEISIKIVDNDLFEFDEEFFIRLKNPKATNAKNLFQELPVKLDLNFEAMVIIIDDDHAGQLGFDSQVYRVSENEGIFHLTVFD